MPKRTFFIAKSQHRPDKMATVWVTSDREFTPQEAQSKSMELAADIGKKCDVAAGYNDRFYAIETVEGKCDLKTGSGCVKVVGVEPRAIEAVVEPKCVPDVIKHVKKNWGGKTKMEKAWE